MLQNNNEYSDKVYTSLNNIYNIDYLPNEHKLFLNKLKHFNFIPKVCYDIGSCLLHWTRHANIIWDNTNIILFEAFEPVKKYYDNYQHYMGVLSDEDNKLVKFYQNDEHPGGNSYYREIQFDIFPEDKFILKNTKKLDTIVKENNIPYPDLIKIDVQGSELDILKGAINVLNHTHIIIIEMQHTEYNEGAPNVLITKSYLESIGWRCMSDKFCKNNFDADYCFINMNYENNIIYKEIDRVYNLDLLDKNHLKFLYELKEYGFNPECCFDIGSSTLHWARHAEEIWHPKIILFDAFEPYNNLYEKLNYEYNICLLSNEDNKLVKFYENDLLPAGNSYYREIIGDTFSEDKYTLKTSITLDTIVKEKKYSFPDLIKLDVQGAELDVLKGAVNVLKHTKLLILEMQHIEYNLDAPNVLIVKQYLESIGWECIAEKFAFTDFDGDYCFINKNKI
jgi:FkbM family methyltransferase